MLGGVMMKCEKCEVEVSAEEKFEHSGHTLCEDCYLDIVTIPKTCDPWAVHSAKNTALVSDSLTAGQQEILDLIKKNGPLTAEEICAELSIDSNELQRNFATLRHMELARGFKKGDQVYYTLFNDREEGN
jgi:transcription initiation factor IIE alpha subunit